MSWRETLGIAEPAEQSDAQNPHNTQKPVEGAICADIADSAHRDSEQEASKLLEALADACKGLDITPTEVKEALVPEDIDDWRKGAISADFLVAFARALAQRRMMDQGKRPDHYTKQATCKHCGPIWLWFSGEVLACPWCWNQAADRPIPRPHPVRCGDCAHFARTGHPHLGHCSKGEPEAVAGLWDTDRRNCQRFLPIPRQTNNEHPRLNRSDVKRSTSQMISEKFGGEYGWHR